MNSRTQVWMRTTAWHGLPVLVGLLFLVPAGNAHGQLGRTDKELIEAYGKGERVSPLAPADDAVRHSLDDGQSVEFGLIEKRVVYARTRGKRQTVEQVSRTIQRLAPAKDARSGWWHVDQRQAVLYPPLGKNLLRCIAIPVRVAPNHVRQRNWKLVRTYFDGYGRQLGQQDLGHWKTWDVVPHVEFVRRYYPARRAVVRFPMIRADGQAYATCDLTYDSESCVATTEQLLVATADCYWQMVFGQLQQGAEHPYAGEFPNCGNLHYEKALASLLPPGMLPHVLGERYLECLLATVDDPQVSVDTVRLGAAQVDVVAIARRIGKDLDRQPLEILQRRAAACGTFGWFMAAPALIDLLGSRTSDEATRIAARQALLNLAARLHDVPRPADPTNDVLWQRWWRNVPRRQVMNGMRQG